MRALAAMALVAGLVLVSSLCAQATPFPISGGSYTADVAYRVDAASTQLSSATGTLVNCSTQFGSPGDTVNLGYGPWALMGMQDASATATSHIVLDKVYNLNKILTQYGDFLPSQYEIRTSPDGASCFKRPSTSARKLLARQRAPRLFWPPNRSTPMSKNHRWPSSLIHNRD